MTGPLGRIVHHDPRSRQYAYKAAPGVTYASVQHTSHIGILDQGQLGSCTGNATVGALGCDPFYGTIPTPLAAQLDEQGAVAIYSAATRLDDAPGQYPPTDTGSSGLAAAKAAQTQKLISGYRHAFTLADALAALQDTPVITGITWYSSFDTPDPSGLVSLTHGATIRGGHEICADGYDADKGIVWFRNSWGTGWGVQGRFCMTAATWAQLLANQGDVTVMVPLSSPPPTPAVDVDAALAAALRKWEPSILTKLTKAGQVKAAGDAWMASHGL